MSLLRSVSVIEERCVKVVTFLHHTFSNLDSRFCSTISFGVVWCRASVLETVGIRKVFIVITDELWPVVVKASHEREVFVTTKFLI